MEEARRQELIAQRRLRGRASHIFTSPQGVMTPVGVGTKQLTGA